MIWILTLGALSIALAAGFVVAWRSLVRHRRDAEQARAARTRMEQEFEGRVRHQVARQLRRQEAQLRKDYARRRSELKSRESELKKRRLELNELRGKLEERAAALDARAEEMTDRATGLDKRTAELSERARGLESVERQARERLEQVADLTSDQARQQLLSEVEHEIGSEVARLIQKADREARASAEEEARNLMLRAMTSLKVGSANDGTVTLVKLPSDEMKGRIIGREGRNIRALEYSLGVDLMVDDTPGAILLSSWDPLRRTIATRSLQKLIEDGRIHPARIEEVVAKTREEADGEARERGEAAAFEIGITGLDDRLMLLLGRLSFHTDHGHNLLRRSVEVALLAGAVGDELRLDGDALRRAGLLHEIARAEKSTIRTHPSIASADLASRHGEPSTITDPIRALAQPPDAPRTPLGVILTTARRFAIARPGARSENLQRHMDRLKLVEQIALDRPDTESAVAVHAGRELRVHVKASNVGDEQARRMARSLAREIEKKVDYSGAIRVLVIRETRAVSYAV
jgi:ribonuclease Y